MHPVFLGVTPCFGGRVMSLTYLFRGDNSRSFLIQLYLFTLIFPPVANAIASSRSFLISSSISFEFSLSVFEALSDEGSSFLLPSVLPAFPLSWRYVLRHRKRQEWQRQGCGDVPVMSIESVGRQSGTFEHQNRRRQNTFTFEP